VSRTSGFGRRKFLLSASGLAGIAATGKVLSAAQPCPPPMFNVQSGGNAATSCGPAPPPTVVGPPPAYIAAMADYQVLTMNGALAPTNGKATMASVTPSEWLTSDPGLGLRMVVDAWSGGGKGKGTKLVVHGGGHGDSANNGVYIYDFAGTTKPTGWTLPSISPVSAVRAGSASYADGKPVSVHTYSGLVDTSTALYRFLGASYPTGGTTLACWKYTFATAVWTNLGNYSGNPNTPACIYDEVSNKILIIARNQFQYQVLNCNSGAFSAVKETQQHIPENSILAYDSRRRRAVEIGPTRRLWPVDWSSETMQTGGYTPSGVVEAVSWTASCALYDQARDVFWVFGGDGDTSGYTKIYQMNAATFAVTAHALSAPLVGTLAQDYQGSWDRFVWMDGWRAIGFVSNANEAPVVIKLPA
jgi:hypothetical protein